MPALFPIRLLLAAILCLAATTRLDAQALSFQTTAVPAGQVNVAYVFTLQATGGTGGYTYSLNSGTIPTGITLSAGGVLQGTPTIPGSYIFTVRAQDSSQTSALQTFNLLVATGNIGSLEITTISLPQGQRQTGYNAQITAAGGTPPYNFSAVSGALPNGIFLLPNGQLQGTPNVAGTFNFTAQVTDSVFAVFQRSLTIVVNSNVLAVSTATLPNAQLNVGYNASLAATGGTQPYTFGIVSGALPQGLTLSTGGAITGTPGALGTSNFRVRVTDSVSGIAERDLTLTVGTAALSINVVPVPSAVNGVAYSFTLTATGGSPNYSFSVVNGSLPPGLSLASTGVLSGTPTSTGVFPFTARVTDTASNASQGNFTIAVNATALTIFPTTLPAGSIGQAYNNSLTASGGVAPYSFSLISGSLPAGLTLSTAGTINGFPTVAGTSVFTVGVLAGNGANSSAAISITISSSAVIINSSALGVGAVGQVYSSSLNASGGTPPYTFTLVNGTTAPPGLTLFGTGSITGTPSQSGNFNFTVRATDSVGLFAEQNVTLSVASSGLTITTSSLPSASLNNPYSATVTATGGLQPYSFAIAFGGLPPGLTLGSNGGITGTPSTPGAYSFTVRVTDNFNAQALANYTIVVNSGVITLQPSTLPNATPGASYSAQLTASGGSGTYNFSLQSGQLPTGLSLSVGGFISGTPSTSGIFNFTVLVTDSTLLTAQFAYSLTVTGGALSITNTTLPTGLAASVYFASLSASGGLPPYSWSAPAGGLPPGLSISESGNISGTPTTPGNYVFLARVRDQNNTTFDANISVLINTPGTLTITTTSLPAAQVNVFYNQQLNVSGGNPPYSWTVSAGQLPPGVTLSSSGLLSGTPTVSGSYSFTVRVESGTLSTQTTLTVAVSASGLSILTSSLPAAAIGQGYLVELASTGGSPPYAYTLFSGALPTGLTLNGNGTISGIPAVGGSFPLIFRVVDTAGNSAQTTLTLTVGSSLLTFTTETLPNAFIGQLYNTQLQASGGTAPYTFSIANGTLPNGLSLSQAGVLSGTPFVSSIGSITFRVTDLTGASVTKLFSIAVGQSVLQFTNSNPPNGVIGQPYSFTFVANGGTAPYSFTIVNGAPPSGVTLSLGGVLSGIPTQTGGFGFTVRATDSTNASVQNNFQFNVSGATFSFTTTSLPAGRVGEAYSAAVVTNGGQSPISYFLNPGGTFPSGLSLNANGTITGTPTAAGNFTFNAAARDSSPSQQTTQTQLTIVVNPAAPRFLTSSLPEGATGTPYSQTLAANGGTGALNFSILSGNLPQGLTLASSGLISGTPAQSGSFTLTFRVTDSATPPQTADLVLVLAVAAPTPLTLSNFVPPAGQLHFPYTTSFTASGGRPPYGFTIDGGSPPNGLRLDPGGVLTGLLLAPGNYRFRVRVSDASSQSVTLDTSITVDGGVTLPAGQVGVGYNGRIQPGFGTGPYTITLNASAIGRLPEGLTLNTDGALVGTPLVAGEYTFGLLIRDATALFRLGTATLRINPPPAGLRIPLIALPNTSVGANYNQTLVALGAGGNLSWSVRNGNLPNGLLLNPNTGVISGIANVPGNQNFTVEVRDTQGGVAAANFLLVVTAAGPPVLNATVSAASYAPSGVVPGELIVFFGNTLGPATLTSFSLVNNLVPTLLANTRVLFDGEPAPIIYTRNDQVGAIAPWGIAGKASVRVSVEYLGVPSAPFLLPVLAAKPGLFSANASGSGPGAILNENGTLNTASNPAAKGSIVVLYATGGGLMNPPGVDGRPAPGASSLLLPTTVTVGGLPAEVQYSGNAPGLVEGVIQVNIRLSPNTPSGSQPVVLTIGGQSSPATVSLSVL